MATPRYGFRHRVELPENHRLAWAELELILHEDLNSVVWLRSGEGAAINNSGSLLLYGTAYDTDHMAREAGESWRARLERALAVVGIGADFGDSAPFGGFTAEGLRLVSERVGVTVMNDEHGLVAYPTDRRIQWVRTTGSGVAVHSHLRLTLALEVVTSGLPSHRERVAYSLLAMAQRVPDQPEVQVVTLDDCAGSDGRPPGAQRVSQATGR